MTFAVVMGVPEMQALWDRLEVGARAGTLTGEEKALARKLFKAVRHLGGNPFHPGLQSHEIDHLTVRFGRKVYQSYLENQTPAAGRLFWVYGPARAHITVVGLEPHPEDGKNGAYARVLLSDLPPLKHPAPPLARSAEPPSKGKRHRNDPR